jgi:hypothetical protein
MKKLSDDEKLTRGVQILLTAQDKADLERMALEAGVSLSAAARPHVIRALDRWRSKNPEAAALPSPPVAKPLVVDGKTVRSKRIAELYHAGGKQIPEKKVSSRKGLTTRRQSPVRAVSRTQ